MNSSYTPLWIHHTPLYEFAINTSINSSDTPLWISHTSLLNSFYTPLWILHTPAPIYKFFLHTSMNSSYKPLWHPHAHLYECIIHTSINSSYKPLWIHYTRTSNKTQFVIFTQNSQVGSILLLKILSQLFFTKKNIESAFFYSNWN